MNLLIGIIGGIYSSVIVSRVFLLREEMEEQLSVLREKAYYIGFLVRGFDLIEKIKKLQSDTSSEIKNEISADQDYLRTHDIIRAGDVYKTIKEELLDKTIEKICHEENPLALKHKQFIQLKQETEETLRKYQSYTEFKFEVIDNSKDELKKLERKYEICLSKRNRYLFVEIIKDKIIAVLFILLIAIGVLILCTR